MSEVVVTISAYDERFAIPRERWRCLNVATFQPEFLEWIATYAPGLQMMHNHKRVRSHNGWGNRGGWMPKATTIDLFFPNSGAEMVFRMAWDYFR